MMPEVRLDEDTLDLILTKLARYALEDQLRRKRGGIVGHSFTSWKCLICKAEAMYPNTGVPLVCPTCERTLAAISLRDITIEPIEEPND